MNHQKNLLKVFAIAVTLMLSAFSVNAQVQTARYNTVINSYVKGFYEYLPEGYNSGTEKYPLMIFFHGAGERGDGSTAQLPRVLSNGVPKLIKNGQFPKSFTVNGQTHKFIVISPQLVDVSPQAAVNDIINYAIANYRVDASRIYLTGLSMGGGMCFLYLGTNSTYANRIAAMVPVCEAYGFSTAIAQNIANANIAVWATHNNADPTVSVTKTHQYVDAINSYNPVNKAKKTIFTSASHDAWTKTYDPNFRENGMNVYEWLLQYSKGGTTPPPAPNVIPTVTAGADQTITLPVNSVTLNGNATDADGTIASYAWTKVSGPSQGTIVSTTQKTTVVNNLVQGSYVFRLTAKDNVGASAVDNITITVNAAPVTPPPPPPPSTELQRILIDMGATATGTDQWGKYWNNFSNVQPGKKILNVKTTKNTATTLGVEVINRIDGTFGTSAAGVNTGNSIGIVGDYPASATTDFAFAHYTTTSGKWKVTGMNPSVEYRIKFWGAKSHNNNYSIQIKQSDETAWKEYNASFNTNFDNAAVFVIKGKSEVIFDIKTKANTAGFGYINVIDIQAGEASPGTPVPNQIPVVNAGADQSIDFPATTATLSGTASDPDGTIATYAWRQLSGPATSSIANATQATAALSNLVEGSYSFELKVTDNDGGEKTDTIIVRVNPSSKYVKVNVFGGAAAYSNTQWNNWNVGAREGRNLSSGNLKYTDGTSSGIAAVLSFTQGVADNGTAYGGTMAPAEVLRHASFATVIRTLTFSGLSATKSYDVEFYASRNSTGNTSLYTINGVTQSVSSNKNLTNKVVFSNIVPDAQGKIVVTLSRSGTYGYLNGFVISEKAAASGAVASKSTDVETETTAATEGGLQLYPNPVSQKFVLQVAQPASGKMQVQIVDMNGLVKKEYNLVKNQGTAQFYLSAQDLTAGNYILRVSIGEWSATYKFSKQ